ncbi:hypothetical protein HanIR_Chr04g0203441 [Helianthus annuus]|nr:hypothetical protein HanIR_Chr04g0203441 [Helianthus annuus]
MQVVADVRRLMVCETVLSCGVRYTKNGDAVPMRGIGISDDDDDDCEQRWWPTMMADYGDGAVVRFKNNGGGDDVSRISCFQAMV